MYKIPRASKALLSILNMGLTVTDNSNWQLVGGDGYIEPRVEGVGATSYEFVSLGLWDNNLQGLKNALKDIRNNVPLENQGV